MKVVDGFPIKGCYQGSRVYQLYGIEFFGLSSGPTPLIFALLIASSADDVSRIQPFPILW